MEGYLGCRKVSFRGFQKKGEIQLASNIAPPTQKVKRKEKGTDKPQSQVTPTKRTPNIPNPSPLRQLQS